jgi:MFS family permease
MTSHDTTRSTYGQSIVNFRLLVLDIAWFGLAIPATTQFLAVYAIRLDASPALLGWLAALPAIMALATSGLAQWWRARFDTMLDALFWPALGYRLAFLLPALTPFLPAAWQPVWLVVAVALPAIPQGIASVLFLVILRESVEKRQLTALMGQRSMWYNVAVALGTLAFGVWLGWIVFPLNYQIMFVAAFGFALISLHNVMRVRVLSSTPVQVPDQSPPARPWQSPGLRRAALFSAIIHLTFFFVVPIIPLRLVNELGADEEFVSIFAMTSTAAGAIMSRYTGRVVALIGSRTTMSIGMIGSGVAGVMLAMMDTRYLALPAGVIGGVFWTLAAISQFTYFSENAPAENATRYMTVYNQVVMLAVFIGPMIGSQLASRAFDLVAVLWIGAALRLVAAGIVAADGLGTLRRSRRRVLVGP